MEIKKFKQHSVLPGFGLTMGLAMLYLSLIVLIPLSTVFIEVSSLTAGKFLELFTSPRLIASFKLSFSAAFIGALINVVFGLLVAWILERYRFPGKRIIDGIVDIPFALPTAVAGIALTAVYSGNGWIGKYIEAFGLKVAYTPLGVIIALTFIGFPFVVRTVQPVLHEMDYETEEAASLLGAGRWKTFTKVIFPNLVPATLTGFALAFARALGEYGSVVFISGNMPMKTEIVPLLIITKLEQYDKAGAAMIAVVMLAASFVLLLCINLLQWWSRSRYSFR
jgi:sulfate/thiosulfate transport system permease protein